MGLAILGIAMLYIIICLVIVILVIRKTTKKRWLWGLLAFVIYNLPLTYYSLEKEVLKAARDELCRIESGFWLYKSPEQWKQENPGVAETLTLIGRQRSHQSEDIAIRMFYLNERFNWIIEYSPTQTRQVSRETQTIVDLDNGEIMAKRVDFYISSRPPIPVPIYSPKKCFRKEEREKWVVDGKAFGTYNEEFQLLGEKQ